jgi:hypothetical protein
VDLLAHASTWETHFRGVLQARETRPNETDLEVCTDINQELFTIEVEKAVKELKNRKACGPDQIYNEYLKDTTTTLKFLICKVIKMEPRKHSCTGDSVLKKETRSAYMILMEIPV